MSKTVLFQTIKFSIRSQFIFISSIDRALSGATIPVQSGPESDSNEGVLRIPQRSSITGNPTIRFSVISRTLVEGGEPYPSTEKQLVYSTVPAVWATYFLVLMIVRSNRNVRTVTFFLIKLFLFLDYFVYQFSLSLSLYIYIYIYIYIL